MLRFHLREHEAEPDRDDGLDREERPVLDDEQVERLLLGAHLRTQRDPDGELAVVDEAAAKDDALAVARGAMFGLALTIPVWSAIAAILFMA